jgi:predicted nucleotidyltransferase
MGSKNKPIDADRSSPMVIDRVSFNGIFGSSPQIDRRSMNSELPGNPCQREILHVVLNAYTADRSILTIGVFGSVARDDSDGLSDIDLDVVVAVDAPVLATPFIRANLSREVALLHVTSASQSTTPRV